MTSNMPTLSVLLVIVLVTTHAISIETVSDNNVTKRAAKSNGDFFPDWVPFKNKKGEQLGEFVQVKKKKPVKRLAHPVNFLLRAVAEADGDDYYDKGQGYSSDSEDYYDKKEWSDTFRSAKPVSPDAVNINNTDVSDIDGIVNIIIQPSAISVRKKTTNTDINIDKEGQNNDNENKQMKKDVVDYTEENKSKDDFKLDVISDTDNGKSNQKYFEGDNKRIRESFSEESKPTEKRKYSKEYNDYEEESTEKPKNKETEEERQAAEAKKQHILGLVDQLKLRHEQEQRTIFERVKEDEFIREERERESDRSIPKQPEDQADKFDKYGQNKPVIKPVYDEYDENNPAIVDKYKISPLKKIIPSTASTTTTTITYSEPTQKRRKEKPNKNKATDSGKLSVFKNPGLFMIYDDVITEDMSTIKPKPETTTSVTRMRSKSTKASRKKKPSSIKSPHLTPVATTNDSNESDRISFVAEENEAKDGEPTLFFPKKRKASKNNRKRKNKTSTELPELDSFVAESIPGQKETSLLTDTSSSKAGLSIAQISAGTPALEGVKTEGSTPSATVLPLSVATDVISAASSHNKDAPVDFHHEKSGEREHYSEHESEHGEDGKKAYEGLHKDTKNAKGHHDKEDHHGNYDDHGGIDKEHHAASDHYGAHHHEEHGKKHAKYEESGKHSKGHSTKGSHDIHKKEEYEKKVEFFEEEGDSAEEEKHGGHTEERSHATGGHSKHGKLAAGHHHNAKGNSGNFLKGGHAQLHKGHRASEGHDGHGKHDSSKYEKGGHASGKKWIYHHGYPAKTANLVAIDRLDKYVHGPEYYG